MKKNILILGAGTMQMPAIASAKELGLKTFVVDGNPLAACASFADEFRPIDLKERDALYEYAKEIDASCHLDAVFTCATDFSANVSFIAEKLHLKAHSYEAALNASDKARMRRCFYEHGVASPNFVEITEEMLDDVLCSPEQFLFKNGFSPSDLPLVIKPCDNMGSRGCRMICTLSEMAESIKCAIDFSKSHRAILEEYMDGPEFSIDSLVYGGRATITGFAERHVKYPPYFIEMGHTMSAVLSPSDYDILKAEFQKGISALGLTHGVAKADIKLTKKGAMIGEIAARLSGGYMSGWTFPYASGINLTRQAILLALGEKPEIPLENDVVPEKFCAERAWVSIPGVISEIYGQEVSSIVTCVKKVISRKKRDDQVDFPHNNVEKCGNIITMSKNRENAVKYAEKAVSLIVLRLQPHNEDTEKFLEQSLDTPFPPSAFPVECDLKRLLKSKAFVSKIEKAAKGMRDWNYRTLGDTLKLFTKITGVFPIQDITFWRYLLRGGIQGALYYHDSKK